jgi:uncharacterized protein (DUF2249 family)
MLSTDAGRIRRVARSELRHCGLEYGARLARFVAGLPIDAPEPGHRPILDSLERLVPGEALLINVDHDPEPLLQIVKLDHPSTYAWEPLLEGPARWVGLITRR